MRFLLLFFICICTLSACQDSGCRTKKTQVDNYEFQDSIYSPALTVWIQQSYDMTISYCQKEPENLRIKFLNAVSHDILATKSSADNTFEILSQPLEFSQWTSVEGSGWSVDDKVFINYNMKDVDFEVWQGVGSGTLY